MTITSVGYDGTVDEVQWAKLVPSAGGHDYGVVGTDDWIVTSNPAETRGIKISAGSGWGHGVLVTTDTVSPLAGTAVGSGSRWDLVVMKRSWSGAGGLSQFSIIPGGVLKQLPARVNTPGFEDDQPIAMVRFTAGQTAVQEIIDLRCWGANGGMVAADLLALTYLAKLGALVRVGSELWTCGIGQDNDPQWSHYAGLGAIPVFGLGASLDGGVPPAGGNFLIQAGSSIMVSDVNGFSRITWPKPFPNGVLSVQVCNGDSSIDRAYGHVLTVSVAGSPFSVGRTVDVVTSLMLENPQTQKYMMVTGVRHRIDWLAIGW